MDQKKQKILVWKGFDNEEMLNKFKERIEKKVIFFNLVKEAEYFVREIGPTIEQSPDWQRQSPQIHEDYKKLLVKCRFLALNTLSDQVIFDLLEQYFPVYLEIAEDIDLLEKFRGILLTMLHEDRDKFKQKAKEALLRSKSIITFKDIAADGKKESPTIGNWLKDYNINLGTGEVDLVKQAQYLTNNPNIRNLSQEEKDRLLVLFNFYERLKKSSLTPQGLEERVVTTLSDGRPVVFKEGFFETIDPLVIKLINKMKDDGLIKEEEWDPVLDSPVKTRGVGSVELKRHPEKIKNFYQGEADEQKIVKKYQEELARLVTEPKRLLQELRQVLTVPAGRLPEKAKVIAILRIIIQNNFLSDLLKDNFFQGDFLKLMQVKKPQLLEGLKISQAAPQYFSLFLQYLLEDKTGLSRNESARIGAQLVNLLKKSATGDKYQGIAYFDVEAGEFEWK